MNKRVSRALAGIALASVIAVPGAALASGADYSFLDGMTVDELVALQDEISDRLDAAETEDGENVAGDFGTWEIKYSKDEFGRENLEDSYVVSNFSGEFSNSATMNDDCLFAVFAFPTTDQFGASIGIRMAEYDRSIVQATFETVEYSVNVLDKDEVVHSMTGFMLEGDSVMYVFSNEDDTTLFDILAEGGPVSFSIKEQGEYATSSYRFTIEDTTGLYEAVASLSENEEAVA